MITLTLNCEPENSGTLTARIVEIDGGKYAYILFDEPTPNAGYYYAGIIEVRGSHPTGSYYHEIIGLSGFPRRFPEEAVFTNDWNFVATAIFREITPPKPTGKGLIYSPTNDKIIYSTDTGMPMAYL